MSNRTNRDKFTAAERRTFDTALDAELTRDERDSEWWPPAKVREVVMRMRLDRDRIYAAARRAEEVVALCTTRKFSAPEDRIAREIGERIGFGALISAASKAWADSIRDSGEPYLVGSQHTGGPCEATVQICLAELREALGPVEKDESDADV